MVRPPPGVLPTIAADAAGAAPHREIDPPPALVELLTDLATRRARADDEHRTRRELRRVAVRGDRELTNILRQRGADGGNARLLERAGGNDDVRRHDASLA